MNEQRAQAYRTDLGLFSQISQCQKKSVETVKSRKKSHNEYPWRKNVLKSVYGLLNAISANRNKSSKYLGKINCIF